ncbi:MAG: DoxX family membrane protein [Bdellovibrionales bacterium]
MSKLPMIARILLGLIFVVFGLNGFFNFLPMPPMPEAAGAFLGGLGGSGYFFPMLKGTEVLCGLALLSGGFVPLALIVLAPIILNIFMFHAFLAPSGLALPIVIGLLEIYLAFFASPYKEVVKQIFRCPKFEALKSK